MFSYNYFNFCFIYFEIFCKFIISKPFYVELFFHNFCYSLKVKRVPTRLVWKAHGPILENNGSSGRWSLIDRSRSLRCTLVSYTSELAPWWFLSTSWLFWVEQSLTCAPSPCYSFLHQAQSKEFNLSYIKISETTSCYKIFLFLNSGICHKVKNKNK